MLRSHISIVEVILPGAVLKLNERLLFEHILPSALLIHKSDFKLGLLKTRHAPCRVSIRDRLYKQIACAVHELCGRS